MEALIKFLKNWIKLLAKFMLLLVLKVLILESQSFKLAYNVSIYLFLSQ